MLLCLALCFVWEAADATAKNCPLRRAASFCCKYLGSFRERNWQWFEMPPGGELLLPTKGITAWKSENAKNLVRPSTFESLAFIRNFKQPPVSILSSSVLVLSVGVILLTEKFKCLTNNPLTHHCLFSVPPRATKNNELTQCRCCCCSSHVWTCKSLLAAYTCCCAAHTPSCLSYNIWSVLTVYDHYVEMGLYNKTLCSLKIIQQLRSFVTQGKLY